MNFWQMPLGLAIAGASAAHTASWAWWERTPPHTHLSLSLETNAGSSLAAPFPFLHSSQTTGGLLLQPHLCPPPVSPCEVLGGAPEPRLVRHPAPCCALPFSPLAFSLHLQRLGRYQGRQDPSPTIHITHLSPSQVGKKKVKQKQTKKSFVQRYIFIIQSLYSTKKERKKGVNFFFHYCR